ncbi:tyrosine-type recombinase/integrase [bacterium]|nr:tyrosine-type recombinase/integrase [bacterium]
MPRPKNVLPTYKRHKTEARCWVGGHWLSLGPYDSPESRAEFARVCAEVAAGNANAVAARATTKAITVGELIVAFKEYAEGYYIRPDGTQTGEANEYGQALRVARELYGHTPAKEFGPLALKAVRQKMVERGWCRVRVNRQVNRVRRCWKWGASEEMVPGSLVADLAAVAGLRKNRSVAPETEPIGPVPDAHFRATLPELVPTVRAMVELQRTAGLRPCEVTRLVPADIDTSGELWIFAPAEHKMSHLGRDKAIPLPPSARTILEPWLKGKAPDEIVFSPWAARKEMYERRRAKRKSKVQPSQADRSKPESAKTRPTRAKFTTQNYGSWIARAAKRAGAPHWHPNQLRHLFASEVRARHGLEVAPILLGHKRADVTQVYAEKNLAAGMEVAKKMG